MNRYEGAPDSEEHDFSWEDELTPEDQRLVDSLRVPVERTPRIGETVHRSLSQEFKNRLDDLRVENARNISRWQLRKLPELLLTPYVLDDVHYAVYEKRREKAFGPFVSISFSDILKEFKTMEDSNVNAALLQRKQTEEAHTYLVDTGLNDETLYKMIGRSVGERFLVRSMARLSKEPSMDRFSRKLLPEAIERGSANPLTFEEVASRAVQWLGRKYREHTVIEERTLSTDEQMWHLLVTRELDRTRAFAAPLIGYISDKSP